MKRIPEFVDKHPKVIAIALGALLIIAVLVFIVPAIGSSINEHRITALETEKQQALKERDAARAQDLILQGKIAAKDEQIQSLTSQIAESNERVSNAHNESQTARTTVNKVRAD